MGKIRIYVLMFVICVCFTGCRQQEANDENQKLKIVAAGFAEYDWIRQIAGEQVQVSMLLEEGVDLHSFQPTVEDMIQIAEADLFIYMDASDNSWVDEALSNVSNQDQTALNLMDLVQGKEIETSHAHEHTQEDASNHVHDENTLDEHIWLSLKNAAILCQALADCLQQMDPDAAQLYQQNAQNYIRQLQELDAQYQKVVESADNPVLIFCDRFPFRYLVDDYGIEYYAAFAGCSTDTESSFDTIAFLAEMVKTKAVDVVMTIEGSQVDIAQTVLDTAAVQGKILTVNSMQSVEKKEMEATTYLGVMEENLQVLTEAWNGKES